MLRIDSTHVTVRVALAMPLLLALLLLGVACGDDDDDAAGDPDSSSNPGDASDATAQDDGSPESEATNSAPENGGTSAGGSISIGEESWMIVPAVQCGIFGSDVVAIAGYAESNEDVEIVIDYDPGNDLVGVRVQGPNDAPYWLAGDGSVGDDLEFNVSGDTVSGSGSFYEFGVGDPVPGSFEVTC